MVISIVLRLGGGMPVPNNQDKSGIHMWARANSQLVLLSWKGILAHLDSATCETELSLSAAECSHYSIGFI